MAQSKNRIYLMVAVPLIATIYLFMGNTFVFQKSYDTEQSNFLAVDIGEQQNLLIQSKQISVAEWSVCIDAGACPEIKPTHKNAQAMTGVNWYDVQSYLSWRSKQDKITYRLPTHKEWVLAAAELAPIPKETYFKAPELAWADYDFTPKRAISDTKDAALKMSNSFGILGLQDGIWEWTSSCRETQDIGKGDCWGARIAMGSHLAVLPELARDPSKVGCGGGSPPPNVGFRMIIDQS